MNDLTLSDWKARFTDYMSERREASEIVNSQRRSALMEEALHLGANQPERLPEILSHVQRESERFWGAVA